MNKVNIPLFEKMVKGAMSKRFVKCGMFLTSTYRKGLNRAQTYKRDGAKFFGESPSKPGEYPKKLSSQLQKSVTFSVDFKNMVLTVGTNLEPYPALLQKGTRMMKPRPWLTLGWASGKRKAISILASGK